MSVYLRKQSKIFNRGIKKLAIMTLLMLFMNSKG